MRNLDITEIKAFVPARDFALSQRFYTDLGFVMASEGGGVAYFHLGNAAFLLQNHYTKEFADNLQMHVLVGDVDAWFSHVAGTRIAETYDVRVTSLEDQPWGMRDFTVTDPSGVCWRIGQNTR